MMHVTHAKEDDHLLSKGNRNVKRIRRQHLTHIVIVQNEVAQEHHDLTDTAAVIYPRYRVLGSIN